LVAGVVSGGAGCGGWGGSCGGICMKAGILMFIIGCSLMNALFSWFSMIFTAGVALNV